MKNSFLSRILKELSFFEMVYKLETFAMVQIPCMGEIWLFDAFWLKIWPYGLGVLLIFDFRLCQIPHPGPRGEEVGVSIDWCTIFTVLCLSSICKNGSLIQLSSILIIYSNPKQWKSQTLPSRRVLVIDSLCSAVELCVMKTINQSQLPSTIKTLYNE